MKIILYITLVFTSVIYSQSPDTLYPVQAYTSNGYKYGYINREGEIVIEPKYEYAKDFSEGLAFVRIDKVSSLWACINTKNEIIFTINADYFTKEFKDNIAVVNFEDNYFYVDKSGNRLFNSTFKYARSFSNGLAIVETKSSNKNFVINKFGVIVLDTLYRIISNFHYGYAKLFDNNRPGLIDTNFNVYYLDTSFHFPNTVNENRDVVSNFIPVKINNKVGYIDLNGNIKINPIFDYGNDFYEGLASVCLGGKWGFIDTSWKFVIEPQFSRAGCFSEGLAPVHNEFSINGSFNSFIDKSGKIIIRDTTKYYFKNTSDIYYFNEIYWPQGFKNGICKYYSGSDWDIYERYVRRDGKFIWVRDLLNE